MTTEGFRPRDQRDSYATEQLQGAALHHQAKEQLAGVVAKTKANIGQVPFSHEYHTFYQTRLNHFEGLYGKPNDSNWANPRTKADIAASVLTKGSLLYAMVQTGREAEIAELFDANAAETRVRTLTQDAEVTGIIGENLWRPLTTVAPLRVGPIRNVLRHAFGDAALAGMDLGAGPNITAPLLNEDHMQEKDFPGKELLREYARPVNLHLGMGVDLQDYRADPNWARAGLYVPGPDMTVEAFDALHTKATQQSDVFPFLALDATKLESQSVIQNEFEKRTGRREADFVLTSFVMHQLGNETNRKKAKTLVENTLGEGGLWLVLGEELIQEPFVTEPSLKVYKKVAGGLEYAGKPFVLNPVGRGVKSVDLDYFQRS